MKGNSVNQTNIDLIRLKEVVTLTTLQKSTIFKHIRSGLFPRPYKLLGKILAWSKQDILNWLQSQMVKPK